MEFFIKGTNYSVERTESTLLPKVHRRGVPLVSTLSASSLPTFSKQDVWSFARWPIHVHTHFSSISHSGYPSGRRRSPELTDCQESLAKTIGL